MRVRIVAIGRMKQGPERELCARYLERAGATGKPLALTGFEVAELPESRAGSASRRKAEEAVALRAALVDGAVVALDEGGKALTSQDFAERLQTWRDAGRSAVTFLIGGADGLDPELRATADLTLGFSPLTWPHQLARIMLAEQLYRATTIIAGHPYHRE
jgi:23S rRNA (pseudouridine1915-N3)-methyltransferase